jgi:hypothetical protein
MMKFNRTKLLSFYESPKSWDKKIVGRGSHVAAITALIGEDLIIASLRHYWKNEKGQDSRIVSYQCNGGKKSGKRLDAWICTDTDACIYQVEIKNWSAHSLGGYDHPLSGAENVLEDFSTKRWAHYFPETGLASEIAKVAIDMKVPVEFSNTQRKKLICFWAYVVDKNGGPYSIANNGIEVFSASAYLRGLKEDSIELGLPRAEIRLSLLQDLLEKSNLVST